MNSTTAVEQRRLGEQTQGKVLRGAQQEMKDLEEMAWRGGQWGSTRSSTSWSHSGTITGHETSFLYSGSTTGTAGSSYAGRES